jgi:hypothetical protein
MAVSAAAAGAAAVVSVLAAVEPLAEAGLLSVVVVVFVSELAALLAGALPPLSAHAARISTTSKMRQFERREIIVLVF